MWRRIVAAQGAVQLVSAMAALRSPSVRSEDRAQAGATENILVIHDLCTSVDQSREFAECLRELAVICDAWARIIFIDADSIQSLQKRQRAAGWPAAAVLLRDVLGWTGCDELLLGQNLLFLNRLLSESYPAAHTACYGDGLGLNFTAEYYLPTPHAQPDAWGGDRIRTATNRIVARLGRFWARGRQQPAVTSGEGYRVRFERKHLLLANMLDEQWPCYVQLDASIFTELFERIASQLHRFDSGGCRELAHRVSASRQTVVLLSSNFSETQRMDIEDELTCYREMIDSVRTDADALVVIKPHPRDSYAKITRLREHLATAGCSVMVLDDRWTFYVPFESIYLRYIRPHVAAPQQLEIICTSSACLSLEYLFGHACHLGFGAERVQRCFAPKWKDLRQRHEADLARLAQYCRTQARGRGGAGATSSTTSYTTARR